MGLRKDPILLLHSLPLGVSLFSHRPEIQMQTFSPVGQIFTCFSKASTFIFPEWQGVSTVKRAVLPRGLKVLLSCVQGRKKPDGSCCGAEGGDRNGALLSPHSAFVGAGRKSGWLWEKKGPEATLTGSFFAVLLPCLPFGLSDVLCPSYPQLKAAACSSALRR